MYNLPYFKEQDGEVIMSFVREHPFAFITGCDKDQKPVVTQVPVFIDERDGKLFLSGHLMKQTDHHLAFLQNKNALVVFSGAHTYVSASWYTNKQQGSTWNYMSVHARGTLQFLNEAALLNVLKRTTNHFENNPASGANFDDLPKEYIEKMAKAIVAFEIEVASMENVFKLSQNRDEKSFENIHDKLNAGNEDQQKIAKEMSKRKEQLFK